MPRQSDPELAGPSFGIRAMIQMVATVMAIVLFVVGLQMAYGVYRLVQDTLLSPEHFAQIVETWAAPVREAARDDREDWDDQHLGQPLPEGPEPEIPAARTERERTADEISRSSIPDQENSSSPDSAEDSEGEPDGPESDVASLEGEDSHNASPLLARDPAETLDEEASETAAHIEQPAEREPADGITAPAVEVEAAQAEAAEAAAEAEAVAADWPPPREARAPPAGPIDVMERFLDNLRQQDLGRAGAGLLIVLLLFVLVKIPIALLTIGGNILASLLKTSQTVQAITVRTGKSNSDNRRQRAGDDSDRPLQVGDLS